MMKGLCPHHTQSSLHLLHGPWWMLLSTSQLAGPRSTRSPLMMYRLVLDGSPVRSRGDYGHAHGGQSIFAAWNVHLAGRECRAARAAGRGGPRLSSAARRPAPPDRPPPARPRQSQRWPGASPSRPSYLEAVEEAVGEQWESSGKAVGRQWEGSGEGSLAVAKAVEEQWEDSGKAMGRYLKGNYTAAERDTAVELR